MRKTLKEIASELANKAKSIKSVKSVIFNPEKNRIEIECIRYYCKKDYGMITDAQFNCLEWFADYQSRTNMRKLNKWCASLAIGAIKDYDLKSNELYIAC